MTLNTLIVALSGGALGLGISFAIFAVRWPRVRKETFLRSAREKVPSVSISRKSWYLIGAGLIFGILYAFFTGWPIFIVAAPFFAWFTPMTLGEGREKKEVDNLRVIESWVRQVVAVSSSGSRLEATLITTGRNAKGFLTVPLRRLAARLSARWRFTEAIAAFRNEANNAVVDTAVAYLVIAHKIRGQGVSLALQDLAEVVREEIRAKNAVMVERARPRNEVLIMVVLMLGNFALLPFYPVIGPWYATVLGQLTAGILMGFAAGGLYFMRQVLRPKTHRRASDDPIEVNLVLPEEKAL